MKIVYFIIILFIGIFVSCSSNKNGETNCVGDEICYLQRFIDSSNVANRKIVLCFMKHLEFWKNYSSYGDSKFYGLDSLHFKMIQKLVGKDNENLCIVIDSGKISKLFWNTETNPDKEQQINVEHLADLEIRGINNYLSLMNERKGEFDTLGLVMKFDSLCKYHSNFQFKYILFELLPDRDSIKKVQIASQLWNNSNSFEKKIYAHELLKIFSYLNEHLSYFDDIIYFKETKCDLGELKMGSEVIKELSFKNIGEAAVIILGVESSCGCTVASYPKYPIKPGVKDKIIVHFKASSLGAKRKTLTLKMFGSKPVTITIKANVY
jgi:hypothetical protein